MAKRSISDLRDRVLDEQDRQAQEQAMKGVYDPQTDTLTIELTAGKVAESDESRPEVILDYDEHGNLLGLEVLNASRRVDQTRSVQRGGEAASPA
jgi:uncharacterized protein YuzE